MTSSSFVLMKTSFRVSPKEETCEFDKTFSFVSSAACDFQLKRNSKIDYLLFSILAEHTF